MQMIRPKTRRRGVWLVSSIVLVSSLMVPMALAQEEDAVSEQETERLLRSHAISVTGLLVVLQQVLGPLPAVAGTPFLGLAVLSGAAMISELDFVQDSDNSMVPSAPLLKRSSGL